MYVLGTIYESLGIVYVLLQECIRCESYVGL